LHNEGRLLREKFWDACTLFDVNYRPKQMSVEELESGLRWLFRKTYSRNETKKRLQHFVKEQRHVVPRLTQV